MRQALCKNRPRNIGDGGGALFAGAEVARIDGFLQFLQCFCRGSDLELGGSGALSAVAGGLEHWIDSLWSSAL